MSSSHDSTLVSQFRGAAQEKEQEAFSRQRQHNRIMRQTVQSRLAHEPTLQPAEKALLLRLCTNEKSFPESMIEETKKTLTSLMGLQLGVTVLNANLSDARLDREEALNQREKDYARQQEEGKRLRAEYRQRLAQEGAEPVGYDPLGEKMRWMRNVYDRDFLKSFNGSMLELAQNLKEAEAQISRKYARALRRNFPDLKK